MGSHLYQIQREQIQPRLRGQAVRVEQHLDGRLVVRTANGELSIKRCEFGEPMILAERPKAAKMTAPAVPPTAGRRRWMYGFRDGGPSLEHVMADAYSAAEGDEEGSNSQ
jgi:hypothetical protein